MVVKEYGSENKDVVVLLHGGGLSWWNYIDEIELLKNDFHLIIPILDGHSGSDCDFSTIENNAEEIIKYIDDNFQGKVKLIGGLSLGGQILIEILSQRENICEHALIESALTIPMPITYKLIKPTFGLSYGLIKKKWFSKMQFASLKMPEKLFPFYYEDSCKISKDNLIAFMRANANYTTKPSLSNNKAKALVLVGEKERPIMIKSAKIIHEKLLGSQLQILGGYYHGDISLNHPKQYVETLLNLIKSI
ncbi:MAG: alpha/beta fold hydrolase [Christensenellales bacterium]